MKQFIISVLTALLLISCADKNTAKHSSINQEAALRNPPIESYPPQAMKTEGSLFSDDAQLDLYSDLKAKRVGDIITINIVENSKANKTSQTNAGRNSSLTANIDALLGYESPSDLPVVGGAFKSQLGKLDLTKGVSGSYKSSFNGSGATSRNETMTAKISARIVQVLPNGNLVVRGSQEILVNNETQYITVQGVVRPADIATDNSILSTYMADSRIDYTGKGDISRKQREGWLTRILDVVWPF